MEDKKKYYVSSDGTKKDVTSLNGEYLINAGSKKRKDIYKSESKEDFEEAMSQLKILEEEYHQRLSQFAKEKGFDK